MTTFRFSQHGAWLRLTATLLGDERKSGDPAGDNITADNEKCLGGDSASDNITADNEKHLGGDSAGDKITEHNEKHLD